jgi:hypothetical protein
MEEKKIVIGMLSGEKAGCMTDVCVELYTY